MNIFPIIIFILVILASSMISAKKKRDRQADQQEYEEEESEPEVAEQTYAPGFPSSQAESYIPVMEPERKSQSRVQKRTQSEVRNSAIQSPDLEGVSAIKRTKGNASTEDPYAQHPDVPAAESDWRKAILAHEILKTKF